MMPNYNVINKRSKKQKTIFMTISEMEQWEKDNPSWEVLCGAPLLHSGGDLGLSSARSDSAFNDKIKEIKKRNPRNTIGNYIK
jgi:hypothetical protein